MGGLPFQVVASLKDHPAEAAARVERYRLANEANAEVARIYRVARGACGCCGGPTGGEDVVIARVGGRRAAVACRACILATGCATSAAKLREYDLTRAANRRRYMDRGRSGGRA